jgi:hypothetical protein
MVKALISGAPLAKYKHQLNFNFYRLRQQHQTVMNHFMTGDNIIDVLSGDNVINIPVYISSIKHRISSIMNLFRQATRKNL